MSASIWTPGSLQVPALPAVAPVLFVPGTVSAPGISFVGDADTGFWQTGPGVIKAAVNGDNIFNILPEGIIFGGGKKLRLAPEVDLASAATCDIGAAASNYIRITGTTGITSFGTNYAGPMFIRFEGALTLTNSSTLIIPGGANLTTAAGDCAIVVPKATAGVSDGWYIVAYQRAVGTGSFTTLTTSGSVGIGGPVSGTFRLDVQRSDTSAVARFYQGGAGLATQVYFNNVGSVNVALLQRSPTGEFLIQTTGGDPVDIWTGGAFRARFDSVGNFGIGGFAPAGNRLHVSSSSIATGADEHAGRFEFAANVPVTTFNQVGLYGSVSVGAGYTSSGAVNGVRGAAILTGAAAVGNMTGVLGSILTTTAGVVTIGMAFRAALTNSGGATFTSLSGFYCQDTTAVAANVASFRGLITSGANKYNLYMEGTADNYLAGNTGIGALPVAGNRFYVSSSAIATGAAEFAGNFLYSAGANTSSFSQVACQGTITAAAGYVGTSVVGGVRGTAVVGAAGLTIPILSGVTGNVNTSANSTVTTGSAFRANFSNAGGSVFTTVAGYFSEDFSVSGTTVASFYSLMASGTNKYGVYIAGTAPNWFNGDVLIFGAGNLGYTTGAGGSVTQLTSRTTSIPAASLDKSTGSITMFSAAGSATAASFTVNNSKVGVNDTINLSVRGATNKYIMMVTNVAAGSYEITFFTTGGVAVDAPVINFSVIKGSVT